MNSKIIKENNEVIKKILFGAKVKAGQFFTQIPAKKFYKKYILSQSTIAINNKLISDGEYTINAFGSMLVAFKNTFESFGISSGDTVLAHPFMPVEIIDNLKNDGINVIFYSIDVDTLSILKPNLKSLIDIQKPKLILHYSINQLLDEIKDELDFINQHNTQLLIIDNNTQHNLEYFELINDMSSGAYIQLLSNNLVSQLMNNMLGIEVPKKPIYLSLKLGEDLYNSIAPRVNKHKLLHSEFADTIYQLLFNQQQSKGIMSSIKDSLIKQTLSSQKNLTHEQLIESFGQIYNRTCDDMVPDYIFELIITLDLVVDSQSYNANLQLIQNINSKKLKIKNLIDNHQQDGAAITIPKACMERPVSAFHFGSEDQKHWYNTLKYGGLEFYRLPIPHDDLFNLLDDNINEVINKTLVTIL